MSCRANKRRKRSGVGEPGESASVTLLLALPDNALLAGELELIQAHLAGLVDRVFAPEIDSEANHGDDKPWP